MQKVASINNPLIDSPPSEVPLANAPLVRVIAQVRFPLILAIEKGDIVSQFQEKIRKKYPILKPEKTQGLILGRQGFEQTPPQITWRFSDVENRWRVSLTPNFMALETTNYLSRTDFLEHLRFLLVALQETFNLNVIERFGLRYIDRLVGQHTQDISCLVRSEIAGITNSELKSYIQESINQSLFIIPEEGGQILAKWGLIAANTTFDPSVLEPIAEPSWILDLDMSLSKNREFSVEKQMAEAKRFSERLYTFFRWIVQDEFLRRFGGEG
ncbi:TIGR04255 family protein [Picosynechococcus sp. NKBG042902]|uniref:TIGR04255 family protein n=1 Tax=Picosynechococcus sp. NKBG042902 TaxID=490193 RepID=UPI0004AB64A6|nr:TIGR04255 family protein [Picosynechococcus sp. NKBG042902]